MRIRRAVVLALKVVLVATVAATTTLLLLARDAANHLEDESLPAWKRWEAHRRRTYPRPVLRGEARPGDAGADYAMAAGGLEVGSGVTPWWPKGDELKELIDGSRARLTDVEREMVAAHATRVEAMRRGTRAAQVRPNLPQAGNLLGAGFGIIALARLAGLASFARVEDGRCSEALDVAIDTVRYGHDSGRGGDLLDGMLAVVATSIAARTLAAVLGRCDLPLADLEARADTMRALRATAPSFADVARTEQLHALVEMTGPFGASYRAWLHPSCWLYDQRSDVWLPTRRLAASFDAVKGEIERCAAAWADPSRPPDLRGWGSWPPSMRCAGLTRYARRWLQMVAFTDLATLAVAARAHAAASGALPDRVEDLAPRIGELPADPFATPPRPYGLRRDGPSALTLFSMRKPDPGKVELPVRMPLR